MNPEPNHDESCQLCNSASITAYGCTKCGAERYVDLEDRIFWTDTGVIQNLVDDPEGKIDAEVELDPENEESVDDDSPDEHEGIDSDMPDGGDLNPDADESEDKDGDEGENENQEPQGEEENDCTYCEGTGEVEREDSWTEDDTEPCPECGGTGKDDGKDDEGDGQEGEGGEGEQDEDEFPDNEDGDMEIPPNEEPLGENEDPFPEPVTIRILSIGSKLKATKWLLAVTEMRDGKPYKIKKAKGLIKRIKQGRTAIITEMPPFYSKIVHMAARDCGVVLDMEADKQELNDQQGQHIITNLEFGFKGLMGNKMKNVEVTEYQDQIYTNDAETVVTFTDISGNKINLQPGDTYTIKGKVTLD